MLGFVMLVFAFAGLVKGVIGLGLPAIAMGLLSIVLSPFQAASLLIIPSLVTNFWQLFSEGGWWILLRRFWTLLLGVVVGSTWSIFPTLADSHAHSALLLGMMLLLYGIYGLCSQRLPNLQAHEKYLSPIVGYLGGALTVATGVILMPVVPYLQSLQLQRNDLVQTLGLTFTCANLCLAVFLQQQLGATHHIDYLLSCLVLVPALVGMWGGKLIRQRLDEQKFRRIFFIGLIFLGGYMSLNT